MSFKGTVSPDRICLKITAKDTVGLTRDIWNAGQNTLVNVGVLKHRVKALTL